MTEVQSGLEELVGRVPFEQVWGLLVEAAPGSSNSFAVESRRGARYGGFIYR